MGKGPTLFTTEELVNATKDVTGTVEVNQTTPKNPLIKSFARY